VDPGDERLQALLELKKSGGNKNFLED